MYDDQKPITDDDLQLLNDILSYSPNTQAIFTNPSDIPTKALAESLAQSDGAQSEDYQADSESEASESFEHKLHAFPSMSVRNYESFFTTRVSCALKPTSFGILDKQSLCNDIATLHQAALSIKVHSGLAKIYDDIPANEAGIEALIHDPHALKYASKLYRFLKVKTPYVDLLPTFKFIEECSFEGSNKLAAHLRYTSFQALVYDKVYKSSDIRLPSDKLAQLFVKDGPKNVGKMLQYNKNLDPETNKAQARGFLLYMAYCAASFLD